jgi:hypothetical protein
MARFVVQCGRALPLDCAAWQMFMLAKVRIRQ